MDNHSLFYNKATIFSKTANRKNGNGCPQCAGKIVTEENSLATINPKILDEWHPTKNKKTPHEIHAFSDEKVWWLCRDYKHEWKTTPNHRTSSKTGCPKCKEKYNVSFEELAFVFVYKQIFDEVNFNHVINVESKSYKVDLYIPKYRLILEYDSHFHHRKRIDKDTEKSINITKNNYILIRMREDDLPYIPEVTNICFKNKNRADLQSAIVSSIEIVSQLINASTTELKRAEQVLKKLDIHQQRFNILSLVPPVKKKNNIQENSQLLTNQFDIEMNYPYKPEHFTFGSNFQLWWKCEKGHNWEAAPSTRKKGHGCPYCSGIRATIETSLGTVNPEMSIEWDYDKNVGITPFDILPSRNKKHWWMCQKGHSYEAAPNHRSRGEGCPYCAGKKVCLDNCLATINPALAAQWHPSNNGELTPYDVTPGSQKKVWWCCEKGHDWQAVIYSRNGSKTNKPRGCKECYEIGRRRGKKKK